MIIPYYKHSILQEKLGRQFHELDYLILSTRADTDISFSFKVHKKSRRCGKQQIQLNDFMLGRRTCISNS